MSKIPAGNLYFYRERTRNRFQTAVVEKLLDSGMSRKELAEATGHHPSTITRWLNGRGNVTLDSISDLLLALDLELEPAMCSIHGEDDQAEINSRILTGASASSGVEMEFENVAEF